MVASADRQIIVEIGGGDGQLAHGLNRIMNGNSTYIIVDFPELLFAAGTYLSLCDPTRSIYVYDGDSFTPEFLSEGIKKYDFVLVPDFALHKLNPIDDISLMINLRSFHSMALEEVERYLEFGSSRLSGYLYSDNLDRHSLSTSSHSLSNLLMKFFDISPSPEFYDKELMGMGIDFSYHRKYIGIPKGSGRTISTPSMVGMPNLADAKRRRLAWRARSAVRRVVPQSMRRWARSVLAR